MPWEEDLVVLRIIKADGSALDIYLPDEWVIEAPSDKLEWVEAGIAEALALQFDSVFETQLNLDADRDTADKLRQGLEALGKAILEATPTRGSSLPAGGLIAMASRTDNNGAWHGITLTVDTRVALSHLRGDPQKAPLRTPKSADPYLNSPGFGDWA